MEMVLDGILYLLITFIDNVLPVFNLDPAFVAQIDNTIAYIINLISSAGYFVPLGILSVCFGVMLSIDGFVLSVRLVKWVISVVRG